MREYEKKNKKKTKYILSIAFLILLIVVTFVTIFIKYDIKELVSILKNVDIRFVLIGLLMIFVYIYFEGLAMRFVFKSQMIDVSRKNNFFYSAIDYYFCAITPSATGGQPMVAYYMAKDKISLSNVTLTLLINTALFKIVLLVLSIVSIIFCYSLVFNNTLMIVLFFVGFLINIFLVVLCFLAAFKRKRVEKIGKVIIMWLKKMHIVKKPVAAFRVFTEKMDEYEQGAKLIKSHKKEFGLALIANVIQRVAFFSITFFVYKAFTYAYPELRGFSYIDLFAVQVLIALAVDSLPLPGGVGISEYLYIVLFGSIYGVVTSQDMVGSAMLLTRAISFYIPLLVTGALVIFKHVSIIRKNAKNKII